MGATRLRWCFGRTGFGEAAVGVVVEVLLVLEEVLLAFTTVVRDCATATLAGVVFGVDALIEDEVFLVDMLTFFVVASEDEVGAL